MRWLPGRPVRRRPLTAALRIELCEDRTLPSFLGGVSFDANAAPQAVVTADLNNDGIADLVVVNQGDAQGAHSGVSVLMGNGDGSFKPAQNLAAGDHPFAVAVGDLQGDGYPDDLVVANSHGNNLTIWVRNSAGVFLPRPAVTVGSSPESVVLGDFNGDGITDIVVANTNSNSLSIIQGDGDGYFEPPQTIALGFSPRALVTGDFNGDGNLDLAVVGRNGSVNVLLGNGDGTFATGQVLTAGTNPQAIVAGDFNADGLTDLAVANAGSNTVSVFLGQGDGTFQAAGDFAAGANPQGLAVGDFNGDGLTDLAVADGGDAMGHGQGVSILFGAGDGTFQLAGSVLAGTLPQAVAAGDFNGDGLTDLAVANNGGNNVSVLLSNGDGTFFPATPSFDAGDTPIKVVAGDFNGDGIPDLAVLNYNANTLSVLLGNGDGTFQPPSPIPLPGRSLDLVVADLTGDGFLDIAVADYADSRVQVFLGNGDGTFKDPQSFLAGSNPRALVVGDFNNDGLPDLAVADYNGGANTAVSILLGNRDPDNNWRFLAPNPVAAGIQPDALGVGDFNGDGNQDLVVADFASNNVRLLLGDGNGNFVPTRLLSVGTHPTGLVVDDFNGDGVPDVAVVNSDSNSVSVLLANGDSAGTFKPAITVAVGSAPQALVSGDFDGDGIPDLAVVGAGGVKILLGNGNGTFKSNPLSYSVGINPVALVASDLNGDGALDLAVANEDSGTVSILLNDGIWSPRPGAPAPGRGAAKPEVRAASAESVRGAALAQRTATGPTTAAPWENSGPADPRLTDSAWMAWSATAAIPELYSADLVLAPTVSQRTHSRRAGSWDVGEVTWSLPLAEDRNPAG